MKRELKEKEASLRRGFSHMLHTQGGIVCTTNSETGRGRQEGCTPPTKVHREAYTGVYSGVYPGWYIQGVLRVCTQGGVYNRVYLRVRTRVVYNRVYLRVCTRWVSLSYLRVYQGGYPSHTSGCTMVVYSHTSGCTMVGVPLSYPRVYNGGYTPLIP